VKFAFIEEHLGAFSIRAVCRVLDVSVSGYYAWLKRPESNRARRRKELAEKIRVVHQNNRSIYGSPRVYNALKAQGETVCENTVARVMQEHQIRPKTKPRFIPRTTDSNHLQPVAKNHLDRQFEAELPNQKWAVDITYIPTGEGWLYLAGVLDLCSRKIVGWSMADHMKTELVSDALTMAITRRGSHPGLLHHSDRGVQYASDAYQHLLELAGMESSMSGKGDCWDNACAESFWATLKKELVHHEQYATREQARQSIFEYIEVFYNRQRLHSALGYVSPETFEASLN
jgi:transposase InsO family protein